MKIQIRAILEQGFCLFKKKPLELTAFTLLGVVIISLCEFIPVMGILIGTILSTYWSAGFYLYIIRLAKGQDVSFGDFFRGGPYLLSLILLSLLSGLLTFLGLLVIIPGIYLFVGYFLTTPLIIDQGMGVWESMEASRKMITPQWFSFLAFTLILLLIFLLGILCLGIGALVAIPLIHCFIVVCYLDMDWQRGVIS